MMVSECMYCRIQKSREFGSIMVIGFHERAAQVSLNWKRIAENVGVTSDHDDTAKAMLNGWIGSPGHHKNLVDKFNMSAVAVAKGPRGRFYMTQQFVRLRKPKIQLASVNEVKLT